MDLIKISIVLVAALAFIAACSQATNVSNAPKNTTISTTNSGNASTPAPAATVDEVAMGKDLYTTNCMTCHKDSGKGGKVTVEGKSLNPEDLTEDKFKKATDEKLIGYVTDGVEDEGMPSFKAKLTPDQIKMVVKHVRTLQK